MLSPHLLRPFTAQQLNLTRRDHKVMVMAATAQHVGGPSLQVHVPTLMSRVSSTLERTDVVVFVDDPMPDVSTVMLIDAMLDAYRDECALVRTVGATEAVKRLENGRVAEGIDRSGLFSPRPPEVVRLRCLRQAMESLTDETWVCPSALVGSTGGSVAIFDETGASHTSVRH